MHDPKEAIEVIREVRADQKELVMAFINGMETQRAIEMAKKDAEVRA